MRPPLSFVPLLPLLLSLIAGILISECALPLYWVLLPVTAATILYLKRHTVISICLLGLSLGWINADIRAPHPIDIPATHETRTYTATVSAVTESETSTHLTVEIDGIGRCRLTVPSVRRPVYIGDIVTFTATLAPPQNRHDLPDEWDFESHMRRQGIVATAYLQPEQISVTGKDTALIWKIRSLQSDITAMLGRSSLSDDTTAFLTATITGDDSLLSPDTRQDYTTAGLAHILALSGLHVGIIAVAIAIILFPLYFLRKRRTRICITIALLWVYAVMTSLSPSVTRAVIMATLYLAGSLLQRHHSSLNALCFAALVILIFSPLSLYSVGFQLSFTAVAAILLFTPRLNPVSPRRRILYAISSTVCVSIAAMIGTGIISAYYFHTFPLYFLIGNIFVMVLLPIIVGGGVLLIIIEATGCDPQWLCSLLDCVHEMITGIVSFSNSLPNASVNGLYFPAWMLIPCFVTIASLFATLVFRRTSWIITTAIMTVSTTFLFILSRPTFPTREYFIPRSTYHTDIIARDSTAMYLFTTAHESEQTAVIGRAASRYRDYMGRRSVDSMILVTDTFDSPMITRRGRHLVVDNRYFVIVDNDNDTMPVSSRLRPDYTLVCRGFRGNISSVIRNISPDTILLGSDLHPRRSLRYTNDCISASVPYRSLRLNSQVFISPMPSADGKSLLKHSCGNNPPDATPRHSTPPHLYQWE